jgi:hypothetical protein
LFLGNAASADRHEYSSGAIAWAWFQDRVQTARKAEAVYHAVVQFAPADPLTLSVVVRQPTGWGPPALCWPWVCHSRGGAAVLRGHPLGECGPPGKQSATRTSRPAITSLASSESAEVSGVRLVREG